MHWLAYWLGLTSPNKPPYLFWSGVGSDASKLAIVVGLLQHLRHRRKADAHLHRKLDRLAERTVDVDRPLTPLSDH